MKYMKKAWTSGRRKQMESFRI